MSLAPTRQEIAEDPGKFDGTSLDPLSYVLPSRVWEGIDSHGESFSNDPDKGSFSFSNLGEWLKKDKEGALHYFKYVYGSALNLDKLSDNQKAKVGL